jgi:hypothetical protein
VAFAHFAPIDSHGVWGGDAHANLSALNRHDRDADVVADHDLFANASGEDQHEFPSLQLR